MTCEHLNILEKELESKGIKEIFRGKAWTDNCREWVYYDCVFSSLDKTIQRLHLDPSYVQIHSHLGTFDGQEHGLICAACKDGIMGMHPEMVKKSFNAVITFE